jgi:hypothetical protein
LTQSRIAIFFWNFFNLPTLWPIGHTQMPFQPMYRPPNVPQFFVQMPDRWIFPAAANARTAANVAMLRPGAGQT